MLGPGPGTPGDARDAGLVTVLLREFPQLPTLGVCFGMQAIAAVEGASVRRAPEPFHGRLSEVRHSGHPLFSGVPSGPGFRVVRYHSLHVDPATVPASLEVTAHACGRPGADTVIMGLAHRELPRWGVQFHPESISTFFGKEVLANFLKLAGERAAGGASAGGGAASGAGAGVGAEAAVGAGAGVGGGLGGEPPASGGSRAWYLRVKGAARAVPSDVLFQKLYGEAPLCGEDCFWLDSATEQDVAQQDSFSKGKPRARFSFMGGPGGPLWKRVVYWAPSEAEAHAPPPPVAEESDGPRGAAPGTAPHLEGVVVEEGAGGGVRTLRVPSFWDYLQDELDATALVPGTVCGNVTRWGPAPSDGSELQAAEDIMGSEELPFDFCGGFVGYFGYELKEEAGGRRQPVHSGDGTPSAAFFFADRFVAYDHHEGDIYIVALEHRGAGRAKVGSGDASAASRPVSVGTADWVAQVLAALDLGEVQRESVRLQKRKEGATTPVKRRRDGADPLAAPVPRHGKKGYTDLVEACQRHLLDGQSYEICLCNRIEVPEAGAPDPLALYHTLRAVNPAPYSAFLGLRSEGLAVCCSSPERFLKLGRDGCLEAKPIKGTAARAQDLEQDAWAARKLAQSEKDQAENLMIVDLLRNDLGRVCVPGTVAVPHLMEVETYETVHQLVSTVRGRRAAGLPAASVAGCIRAAFPPGSMTGAPKERTMELLDDLEGGTRGVYSGALGFVSVNQTFDLNVVIRTAVVRRGSGAYVGAGGAITVLSDPSGEHAEMELKADPVLRAVKSAQGREVQLHQRSARGIPGATL